MFPSPSSSPSRRPSANLRFRSRFNSPRLSRRLPKAIAAELAEGLAGACPASRLWRSRATDTSTSGSTAAPMGYSVLTGPPTRPRELPIGKIIVEHTNINPNKAAHIGHLRNAILGDTFVRMLRATGREVEVQNYIDNTGVQVADVVVGFHYLEKKSPGEVRALIAQGKFDYLCWDLYARISSSLQGDTRSRSRWRAETLHAIEAGEGELSELGHLVADAIVQAHLATMLRLNIVYDVLPRESEILHLKFWATAFELLKERKAIYFETEGKNKGCWVMPGTAFSEHAEEGDEDLDKIIVRSNGTVTYVGKDIAYQLWKFGLLGKDFYYRKLMEYPGRPAAMGHDDQPVRERRARIRPRLARVQRHRFSPIVPAGCRRRRLAGTRLRAAGGCIRALLL